MQQLLTVIKARYIDGYRIEAVFSNGIKKMIDFAPVIQRAKGIVKKLEDVEFFHSAGKRNREEIGRRGVLQEIYA